MYPGANPTIVIYNASAVIINNATVSLVRSEDNNTFFYFEKRTSLLQRWHWSCKLVNPATYEFTTTTL
jgi:hypothetical protein